MPVVQNRYRVVRMVLNEFNKTRLSFLLLFFILNHELCVGSTPAENKIRVGVGIILDMDSWLGNSIYRCITMAIDDFYALNPDYKTRTVLYARDTKGDPIEALSAVNHLLHIEKVQAIMGPETSLQSKLLALFADEARVPIFSFAGVSSLKYPYLLQIKEDESNMAKSIASVLQSHNWRNVTFIYEDTDDGSEILPYLVESFQDKNIQIAYRCAISTSATLDDITKELRKVMSFNSTIFIVHMSPSLASSFFLKAKKLGMVREEYAWILTEKTTDVLQLANFEVIESLQGVLGFRSYIPASSRLYNVTARWHDFVYRNYLAKLTKEVPTPAIWAYDTMWALAESIEKAGVPHNGPSLLSEVLKFRFKGLSGEFHLSDQGKLISNGYEIISAINYGEKILGYWTLSEGIRSAHPLSNSPHQYYGLSTEAFSWPPGKSTTFQRGRVLLASPSKTLKIGVINIKNFKYFMDVEHDVEKNVTTATGFSIDVFDTCIRALSYEVPYVLITYANATYDDLVQKVYNQELDAVVGDSTILANRSDYVDFTATYSDLGVGTLARIKKHDLWFFLKPLDRDLALVAIASLILTSIVIWSFESLNQPDQQPPNPEAPNAHQQTSNTQSPDDQHDQQTSNPQSPDDQHVQKTSNPQSPDDQHDQQTSNPQSPDDQHDQQTSNPQSPDDQHDQQTSNPQSPDDQLDQQTSNPQSPDDQHVQKTSNPQSPDDQHDQQTSNPQSPDDQHDQQTSNPQSPDDQHDQQTCNSQSHSDQHDQQPLHPQLRNQILLQRIKEFGTIFWLMLMTIFFSQREKKKRMLSKFVLFIWLLVVLILVSGYNATLSSLLTIEQFEFASKGGIVGFHGGSFMRGVTISNLHFEGHKNRPFYSYESYAHALSDDGDADAIVDEIPYIKMFLSRYPGDYDLVSVQPITSGFGFIFPKGSPLVHDISREITRIRFDGTLGNLENKWYENRLSIPSRNSTKEKVMKLDNFGGVFIANAAALGLAIILAVFCYFWPNWYLKIFQICCK